MKWHKKTANNDRCIVSDCGQYQITKFTCGGIDLFVVYHQGSEIGDAVNGNQARRIAENHSKGVV